LEDLYFIYICDEAFVISHILVNKLCIGLSLESHKATCTNITQGRFCFP